MIKKALVAKGFAAELPALQKRIFEFSDGLNVLFGSNGCGKSTLLKCMKAYCGLKHAGWSKISDFNMLGASGRGNFPFVYRAYTPNGDCDTHVEWDGTATFFNDSDLRIDDMAWFYNKDILAREGLTTEEEQMMILAEKPSAGQTRIRKLNKIFNLAANPPDFLNDKLPNNHAVERAEVEYIKSLPNTGRITIMLDEPEKSLSIPKQIELFQLLKSFQDRFQIIISTHSPFILFENDVKIFDMEPGYIDTCKKTIKDCAALIP